MIEALVGIIAFIVIGAVLVILFAEVATPMPPLNEEERKKEWNRLVTRQERKNNKWYKHFKKTKTTKGDKK